MYPFLPKFLKHAKILDITRSDIHKNWSIHTHVAKMLKDSFIYLDNAATSFPKPEGVIRAVSDYMTNIGGNPGRSAHRLSIEAADAVFSAREEVAAFFGLRDPMRVIFTHNATEALNLAILGILSGGGHAVTTSMEHNSVARPLRELEKRGKISFSIIESQTGAVDPEKVKDEFRKDTKLVIINHASNVFGTLQPILEIGKICRMQGIPLLVDAAQSAGVIKIDIANDPIDLIAFTGHKGLLGPTGTGGLVIAEGFDHAAIQPLKFGGTGSNSEKIEQPPFLPDRYESGTLNSAGIWGLREGIRYLSSLDNGIESSYRRKKTLVARFMDTAHKNIDGFISYFDHDRIETGVVSFNIEGMMASDVARMLSDDYGIMCRAGLHCAPLAHKSIGTFPAGTVRFSFGLFNRDEDADAAAVALREISKKRP